MVSKPTAMRIRRLDGGKINNSIAFMTTKGIVLNVSPVHP